MGHHNHIPFFCVASSLNDLSRIGANEWDGSSLGVALVTYANQVHLEGKPCVNYDCFGQSQVPIAEITGEVQVKAHFSRNIREKTAHVVRRLAFLLARTA